MTAVAMDTARFPAPSQSDAVSAALLALGAAALFLGTLFYARLTPELGLPALPASVRRRSPTRLRSGPTNWRSPAALRFSAMAFARRLRRPGFKRPTSRRSDLATAGWALMAVSVVIAMVFNSMTAALFWPLAHASEAAPFLAFKAWFDFLFAAGNVPFGLGLHRCPAGGRPSWRAAAAKASLVCGPRHRGGGGDQPGSAIRPDVLHMPLVIGLSVTFGCLVLAVLGVRILRRGPITD